MGLLFSTVTKKTTTSILASVSTWLFFSIIITIVASLVANTIAPIKLPKDLRGDPTAREQYREIWQKNMAIQTNIQRISPAYLYNEAGSAILGIIGEGFGFIGGKGEPFRALELSQGLAATWPQITAIAVGLVACFAASYMLFLRQEIRPGD